MLFGRQRKAKRKGTGLSAASAKSATSEGARSAPAPAWRTEGEGGEEARRKREEKEPLNLRHCQKKPEDAGHGGRTSGSGCSLYEFAATHTPQREKGWCHWGTCLTKIEKVQNAPGVGARGERGRRKGGWGKGEREGKFRANFSDEKRGSNLVSQRAQSTWGKYERHFANRRENAQPAGQ